MTNLHSGTEREDDEDDLLARHAQVGGLVQSRHNRVSAGQSRQLTPDSQHMQV